MANWGRGYDRNFGGDRSRGYGYSGNWGSMNPPAREDSGWGYDREYGFRGRSGESRGEGMGWAERAEQSLQRGWQRLRDSMGGDDNDYDQDFGGRGRGYAGGGRDNVTRVRPEQQGYGGRGFGGRYDREFGHGGRGGMERGGSFSGPGGGYRMSEAEIRSRQASRTGRPYGYGVGDEPYYEPEDLGYRGRGGYDREFRGRENEERDRWF